MWKWVTISALVLSWGSTRLCAEPPSITAVSETKAALLEHLPTLGSEQFWSDELQFRGWRIQRNALHDGYRLLDPSDVRQAHGTFAECRQALEEAKRVKSLAPLSGKAVLVLHGLGRTRTHMDELASYLEETGKYQAINVAYASTRRSLDEHAQSLAHVIEGLEGIDEIHFVCHSLGNLVVRRYLGEATQGQPRWRVDPRLKRMVMLGPPNQGSKVAEFFKSNDLLGLVAGPSGKQLGRQWSETQTRLATPNFPFGILAGGAGNTRGANPLLAGDDDFVVSVEETRLAGACDFRLLHCLHGAITHEPEAKKYVLSFLDHGYFLSEAERQAILGAPAAAHSQARQP